MSALLHLDTHVAAWLYAGATDRFPANLLDRLASATLRISPMVALELTYLHEIGRLTEPAHRILGELDRSIGLRIDDLPFGAVVVAAERLSWTRDPFDRLIAAQAIAASCELATKDAAMHQHLAETAVWD